MASSATDSQGKDKDIREQLIRTGDVDVMLSVGNNFFYTKSLPCTLWFFDKAKRTENKDKILFIDEGKLVAVGSHAELYENCPDYQKMVDLQKLEEEGGAHNG